MTTTEDIPPVREAVSAPGQVASTAPASRPDRRRGCGVHRRTVAEHRRTHYERKTRLRLLAVSLIGVGCLMFAHSLRPEVGAEAPITTAPRGLVGWITLVVGIAGIWLVPGLWLSALMASTGAGPVARLATRIGTTLVWYALVGPVIHLAAEGARVTPGGIVGMTVAATAAVCLGLLLRLVNRPERPSRLALVAPLAGGLCAQTVIWLSMSFFTEGVSYEHIRRLDWLIVLACGSLTAIGAYARPRLPMVRAVRDIRAVLVSAAVVAAAAALLIVGGGIWSPAQRMPSVIAVEQVAEPPGTDVAFALTGVGSDGPELIQRAVFSVSDDDGRPVAASTRVIGGGTADAATLLVVLDPSSRPRLCESIHDAARHDWPVKVSVREQISGVLVQAGIPAEWCAR